MGYILICSKSEIIRHADKLYFGSETYKYAWQQHLALLERFKTSILKQKYFVIGWEVGFSG